VGFHEVDEVGAGDGLDGAWGEGFGGDVVENALVQSGGAKDVPGAGDAEQGRAAIGGGGGDFDTATEDDQEMVGGEAFADEDGVASRWWLRPMEWKSRRTVLENVKAFSGLGVEALTKLREKMAGLLDGHA
jgi:hypothetical protein